MASDLELDVPQPNGVVAGDRVTASVEPCTPQETGPLQLSQITLPSTEIPGSPIDPNQSFKTEVNDDRPAVTVIPSSLTPPPSTQLAPGASTSRRTFSNSQPSVLYSPPSTVLNNMRNRDIGSDYVPPASQQIQDASAEELRVMLQTSVAEYQKFKMEAAHHKLQFNLLSLQADEESKRAAVEHDMVRRQVDALRMAEHSRQARRELNTTSESLQNKYFEIRACYEAAIEENEALSKRVKIAKKVISQKEEEIISLIEEREMLLNRIRENREHFHMLCSPGGIFHGALTPKQALSTTPQQYRATPKALRREESDGREHGLSALLEAMSQSQDNSNNSAPSTPMVTSKPVSRLMRGHQRNAQSMSSLPSTPMNKAAGKKAGLLPSVNLVPQTEPRSRYSQRRFVPSTPPSRRNSRRKSRESTISAEDNEELARQALESVKAVQSLASQSSRTLHSIQSRHSEYSRGDEEDAFSSQASQAATEMLRRTTGQRFVVAGPATADERHGPAEKSAAMHAKLFSGPHAAATDKRKFSTENLTDEESGRRGQNSPNKKLRAGGPLIESPSVGLGIQYSSQ